MESTSLSLNKARKSVDIIDRSNLNNNESNTQEVSIKKSKKRKEETSNTNKEKSSISLKKKRVVWQKNLVAVVDVPSFKRYNLENCHDDPNTVKEKTRCNCLIF